MPQADCELVALVGRGVGRKHDLAAGLDDAFDRIRRPDVLADRHADAHAVKDQRAGIGPWAKHALLVEHAVVRQVDLEPHRFDPSARKQRRGIVERAVVDPRQADQHRRAAVGGLARHSFAGAAAGLLKRRLEDEVFGRIAGEIELRRHDEPGAEGGGFGARGAEALQIAVDVADDRGDSARER